jgi:hypothetical protein
MDDGTRLFVGDAATGCVVIRDGLSLVSMFFASFPTSDLTPLVFSCLSPGLTCVNVAASVLLLGRRSSIGMMFAVPLGRTFVHYNHYKSDELNTSSETQD